MKRILGVVFAALVVSVPPTAGAGPLGTQMPSNCVPHISFEGSPDLVDDYRCAGLAIEFHTAGVAFSPAPIWAGQWLFRRQVADRVVFIDEGLIVEEGTPADIFDRPQEERTRRFLSKVL